MTFHARLTELLEKATKGRVSVGRKTEYGTIWPDSIVMANGDKYEAKKIASVYGLPINCKREELTEERYAEPLANADLIVLLLNRAEAIRDLVVAAEKAAKMQIAEQWELQEALAKLEEA